MFKAISFQVILGYLLLILFIGGILITFDISSEDITNASFKEKLIVWRLSLYLALIIFWKKVVQMIVFIRHKKRALRYDGDIEDQKVQKDLQTIQNKETIYFENQRMKVVIFLILFEALAVNQLWL